MKTSSWFLVSLLAFTVACGESDPPPVQTAKAYMAALQARDVAALIDLMNEEVAKSLEQAAVVASEQVGGRRSLAATEMLQIVDPDERFAVYEVELLDADETTAKVRVLGAHEAQFVLDLRFQDGRWRVEMPSLAAAS